MTKAYSVRDALRFSGKRKKEDFPIKNIENILRTIFIAEMFEKYDKHKRNFNYPSVYEGFIYEIGYLKKNGNWVRCETMDDFINATHIGFFFGSDTPVSLLTCDPYVHIQRLYGRKYYGLLIEPEKIYYRNYKSSRYEHTRAFLIYDIKNLNVIWNTTE